MEITSELDQIALFGPLMAGHLLNAFYSALLLKKLSGIEMNDDSREETFREVFLEWGKIQEMIEKIPRKKVVLGTSSGR